MFLTKSNSGNELCLYFGRREQRKTIFVQMLGHSETLETIATCCNARCILTWKGRRWKQQPWFQKCWLGILTRIGDNSCKEGHSYFFVCGNCVVLSALAAWHGTVCGLTQCNLSVEERRREYDVKSLVDVTGRCTKRVYPLCLSVDYGSQFRIKSYQKS